MATRELPPNTLNQVIQLQMEKESTAQVVIELHGVFGDKNEEVRVLKPRLRSIEYVDGVLVIHRLNEDDNLVTDIYPWERVRKIRMNEVREEPLL